MSFLGIRNLKTHILEIPHLFPDNQRITLVANESDLASNNGIYDSSEHENAYYSLNLLKYYWQEKISIQTSF